MIDSKNLALENNGHTRFTLDGITKTLPNPVTGAAMHTIAGNPASLTGGGKEVPNDYEPFEIKQDDKFISAFELKKPEKLSQDGVEHGHVSPVPEKV